MKINFLGDSITEGTGADCKKHCYVERVRQMTGEDVLNYGVGGTRIAREKVEHVDNKFMFDFNLRATIMRDADFVFVFGGTNDYGHGEAGYGEIKDNTPFTFYGALNILTDYLIGRYGKDKICFILPLHRFQEDRVNRYEWQTDGKTLADYVDAIKKVCKLKGIEYLNFFDDNFMPTPTCGDGDEYFVDGLHPSSFGHYLIAERICEYLKEKNLIKSYTKLYKKL